MSNVSRSFSHLAPSSTASDRESAMQESSVNRVYFIRRYWRWLVQEALLPYGYCCLVRQVDLGSIVLVVLLWLCGLRPIRLVRWDIC